MPETITSGPGDRPGDDLVSVARDHDPDAAAPGAVVADVVVGELVVDGGDVEHRAAVARGDLEDDARGYARDSLAASTWRAYDSDMTDFRTWCAAQAPPFTALLAAPATVALYLTALAATRKPATIRRRLASISVAHQVAGQPSPPPTRSSGRSGPASGAATASPRARCAPPAPR
ncbi:MAG: hypothetical protein ACRDRK_04560 [Pseudonocardia sp.]